MTVKLHSRLVGATIRFLMAVLLVTLPGQSAFAQGKNAPAADADANNKVTSEEKPSGGPHEGIKVHGHWTIEVRNPDGTLVTHREFENSLTPFGSGVLVNLVGGAATPGAFEIGISGNGPGLCSLAAGTNGFCSITSAGWPGTVNSSNLVVRPLGGNLQLNGYVGVQFAGTITTVGTYILTCAPSISANSCQNGLPGSTSTSLTQASLGSPISVATNQIVQVTVVISFS